MIFWAPLLHIYQPSFQEISILKRVDKECYKPLFSMLEEHDNVKINLNINAVLIELLYEYDLSDSVELLKMLESENKIEIVGTAKFHPILPLIPLKEAEHQIKINEEILKKEFNSWKKIGFFPPEMSISSEITNLIQDLGYKWIIMSGTSCPIAWPYDEIYCSPNGLQFFFRDDILSNKISFNNINAREFIDQIKNLSNNKTTFEKKNKYVITAMDGETFGHHIPKYDRKFLSKVFDLIYSENDIQILFISELHKYFPMTKNQIAPKDSSWSTTTEDLKNKIPYPLWDNPQNKIHQLYWKITRNLNNLMNLLEEIDPISNWDIQSHAETARWFYDRAICSDTIWWANPDRGMWSPNLIYKGIEMLMKAALNAQLALVYAKVSDIGEGYFDAISLYHNLVIMELYKITKKNNDQTYD
jgi:predicted glycosyl hydrolase (DUF1957 family)